MILCYEAFTDLGSISAGFAARLVHAGALTLLMRLVDKAVDAWQAARRGAAAGALDTPALTEIILEGCFTTFGRPVPRVSCRPLLHFLSGL